MPSTTSILQKIKTDYSQFIFKPASSFCWSSADNTIYYKLKSDDQYAYLLHELAHAILNHTEYKQDIELIIMERQAWDCALQLATKYNLSIDNKLVQDTIDSYRDWMHARSTCPDCQATGMQLSNRNYSCTSCGNEWRSNEARICSLRRYKLKNA